MDSLRLNRVVAVLMVASMLCAGQSCTTGMNDRVDAGPLPLAGGAAGGVTSSAGGQAGGVAGGTAGGAPDSGSTTGTANAFYEGRNAAVSARRKRCGYYASTLSDDPPNASDLEFYQDIDRAIADGRVVFDATRAQQCLAELEREDCTEGGNPAVCAQVVTGRVPVGGDCFLAAECAGGGNCGGNTCPFKCLGLAQEGEVATSAVPCASGLFRNASSICERFIEQREGQDCHTLDGGSRRPCESNTYCTGTFDMATCRKPLRAGSACSSGGVCELGTECVSGFCLRRSGVNEACAPSAQVSMARQCQIGLRCDAPTPTGMGTCKLPGTAGVTCLSSLECAAGLLCLGATFTPNGSTFGRCEVPTMSGMACTADSECAPGLSCDVLQGSPVAVCQPLRQAGETCGQQRCRSPLRCVLGVCTRPCHDMTP
jgi:hypothetical protein